MLMSTILIVEDDFTIANLYRTKLEAHDFEVRLAGNGLEALESVTTKLPDIILLDLRMPHMSGEEFLNKFRKNKNHNDIPIIILTNISREEAPKTLWHYGISGYFVKAHNTPADLLIIVNKVLKEA